MPIVTRVRITMHALIGMQHPRNGVVASRFLEIVVGSDAEAMAQVLGTEEGKGNHTDRIDQYSSEGKGTGELY